MIQIPPAALFLIYVGTIPFARKVAYAIADAADAVVDAIETRIHPAESD